MCKLIKMIVVLLLVLPQFLLAQKNVNKKVMLPNGWSLSPAGRSLPLGDLPLNIVVSPSKKLMAVTNNGQSTQTIQLINPATEKILDNIVVEASWYGLKFSADEKSLYVSGGNNNWIVQYAVIDNKLKLKDFIKLGNKWPTKISPAGIEINDASKTMYVVTKDNNSLYTIDLSSKIITQQLALGAEAYACILSPNKKELYISLWGGDKVLVYDISAKKVSDSIKVGDDPNEMLLSKNCQYLYVANANDNNVSVIDINQRKVLEVLNAALYPNAN